MLAAFGSVFGKFCFMLAVLDQFLASFFMLAVFGPIFWQILFDACFGIKCSNTVMCQSHSSIALFQPKSTELLFP